MTIQAFQGGAGCGKTHRLMQTLVDKLHQRPLAPGQRVMALTFMHGSRRRLDGRLRDLGLSYECTTIDSFAWRIVSRWRALAVHLGHILPMEIDYESVCSVAGHLLEQTAVVDWVAATHPVALVDEAQDLCTARLRIVRALAARLDLLLAMDEFQCLNERLRLNPACTWLAASPDVESLDVVRRTNSPDLLAAAAALRRGAAPVSAHQFTIRVAQTPPLAGSWLSNRIARDRRGGSVAIITPTAGRYAKGAVDWVMVNQTSRGNGPYRIQWERGEEEVISLLLERLTLATRCSFVEADRAAQVLGYRPVVVAVRGWLATQHRALGRGAFERQEIEEVIRRAVAHGRRFARGDAGGLLAMTVHGAKNREFDGVVVLWPYGAGGDDEQKRRLLYNAVTRAKHWCLVLVEGQRLLEQAPFTGLPFGDAEVLPIEDNATAML